LEEVVEMLEHESVEVDCGYTEAETLPSLEDDLNPTADGTDAEADVVEIPPLPDTDVPRVESVVGDNVLLPGYRVVETPDDESAPVLRVPRVVSTLVLIAKLSDVIFPIAKVVGIAPVFEAGTSVMGELVSIE
jgi:hypothetical protein